jgi:hypothetical protein
MLVYDVNVIVGDQAVTRYSNSEVNRTVAALAGSSLPYRSFAETSLAPAGSDRTAHPAVGFPLLMAALPEVVQFAIPHGPVAPTVAHERPENPPALAEATAIATRVPEPAATVQGVDRQNHDVLLTPKQVPDLAKRTISFPVDLPVAHGPALGALREHLAEPPLVTVHTARTPLGAVFRTLLAAGSHLEKRHETQSRLQNMFDLL